MRTFLLYYIILYYVIVLDYNITNITSITSINIIVQLIKFHCPIFFYHIYSYI